MRLENYQRADMYMNFLVHSRELKRVIRQKPYMFIIYHQPHPQALRGAKHELSRLLLRRLLSQPVLTQPYASMAQQWLTDARELTSRAWEHLPESEVREWSSL